MRLADAIPNDEAVRLFCQAPVEGMTIHTSFGVCIWAGGPDIDALGGAHRFLGDQGHDLFHPEDQEISLRHHENLLKMGHGRIRQRILDADGRYRWCVITSRILVEDEKRYILGHLRLDEGLQDLTT